MALKKSKKKKRKKNEEAVWFCFMLQAEDRSYKRPDTGSLVEQLQSLVLWILLYVCVLYDLFSFCGKECVDIFVKKRLFILKLLSFFIRIHF